MNDERFQKNVSLWARFQPEAAQGITQIQPKYTFFTETDFLKNLYSDRGQQPFYFHADQPTEEAIKWFESLNPHKTEVIYVYGIGLGYYYNAAKSWLKNDTHFLVFLEDDLEVLYRFLETELATTILEDKQVRLFTFESINPFNQIWSSITDTFRARPFQVSTLHSYQIRKGEIPQKIEAILSFWSHFYQSSHDEFFSHGQGFFSNFYQNLELLPTAFRGDALFNQFAGVPAIICGAGPSLAKNLSILETLGDRALIFAGATAMNAVNSHGLLPHFGVGIDPNPDQYTRLIRNDAFEVPYLYRNRMFHEALRLVQGPKLYVTGSSGYKISEWFEKELGIEGNTSLSEGFNVVNFSLSLATAMGCNPIIFVGLDLAYSEQQPYSPGVISHPIHPWKRHFRTKDSREELVLREDIYGQPIHTLWKWITESCWLAQFAKEHSNILFINATEGGIGITGVPNKPLHEVVDHLLPRYFDFHTRVHGEIQVAEIPDNVTAERIQQLLQTLESSLRRCETICHQLSEEAQHHADEVESKRAEIPPNLMNPKMQELWQQMQEEIGYQYILKSFDEHFQPTKGLDLQQITYDLLLTAHAGTAKKLRLAAERYRFLQNTALINLTLIELSQKKSHPFKQKTPSAHPAPIPQETYQFTKEKLILEDPELGLSIQEKVPASLEIERLYYASGAVKMEQSHSEREIWGPVTFFSEAGQVLARDWYVKNVLQGKSWFYYPNGALYSLQGHRNGMRHGRQLFYYPNGTTKTDLNYTQGKLEEVAALYYPSGQLKRKLHFSQGKRHGMECMWSESGALVLEVEYKHGLPIGSARSWHLSGMLAQEVVYDDSSHPISIQQWDSKGIPIKQETNDYFDMAAQQLKTFTQSLNTVLETLNEMKNLLPTSGNVEQPMQSDLLELDERMKRLSTIHEELLKEAGLQQGGPMEAIWKTPSLQKELEEKIQEFTQSMSAQIENSQRIIDDSKQKLNPDQTTKN